MFKTTIASALVAFAAANNSTTTPGCDQLFTCNKCNAPDTGCGWVKPKIGVDSVATRQCKGKVLDSVDDKLYEAVATCEACDTNDCTDCYAEAGCKFWTTVGNRACSVEKPTGWTSFAWSELTDATCKANAASDAVKNKCEGMKSCNTCKADSDCLWFEQTTLGDMTCAPAIEKNDFGPLKAYTAVDTCSECAITDCDLCQKTEGCKFFGIGTSFTGYTATTCAKESVKMEIDECPVESPAASVGVSAAALAATALAMLMN